MQDFAAIDFETTKGRHPVRVWGGIAVMSNVRSPKNSIVLYFMIHNSHLFNCLNDNDN